MTIGARRGPGDPLAPARLERAPAAPARRAFFAPPAAHFGVRLAGTLMPPLADHATFAHDHATDARIGGRREEPARAEVERAAHVLAVVRALRRPCGAHTSLDNPFSAICAVAASARL